MTHPIRALQRHFAARRAARAATPTFRFAITDGQLAVNAGDAVAWMRACADALHADGMHAEARGIRVVARALDNARRHAEDAAE